MVVLLSGLGSISLSFGSIPMRFLSILSLPKRESHESPEARTDRDIRMSGERGTKEEREDSDPQQSL